MSKKHDIIMPGYLLNKKEVKGQNNPPNPQN
jgi:hypothetical protein